MLITLLPPILLDAPTLTKTTTVHKFNLLPNNFMNLSPFV